MGFKAGFTRALNDYARKVGALKEKDNNLMRRRFPRGHHRRCWQPACAIPSSRGRPRASWATRRCARRWRLFVYARLTEYLEDLKNQDVAQSHC